MEVELLHRIQFGLNLTFHYIFPPLSIGLSLAIVIFEWLFMKTKNPIWESITQFWIRVFALTFALGVATGVPLVFSFGTNWSRWSAYCGDVLGSVLAAEGLFAFTMEAGALGILLFGWKKVTQKVHFAAAIAVSFGAHFSGLWITNVNSWMQTPAGYVIKKNANGVEYAAVTDWWQMAFNPSALSHVSHVILGCWLAGAFLIISVSSYYLLKNRFREFSIKSMKVAVAIASVSIVLQLVAGDHLAELIAKYNPVKFAAFEGVFKTEEYTKAYAFGYVDEEEQKVHGLGIPGLLSYMVHGDSQTPVAGLDQAKPELRPALQAVFQVYHLMIGMWIVMFVALLICLWLWKKNHWQTHPLVLKLLVVSVAFPQLANIAGWYSTCLGRQPWTVYQLLKTKDAYSPSVTANEAFFTLGMYLFIYISLFAVFCFLLDHKIKHGPTELPEEAPYRSPYKPSER
jgi:cytochrome d ubiquinol oxidase subunit I